MAIKTIIVDDHPVVRFGVKQMLSSSQDIEVVAEMDDVDNLLQVLKDTDADILLLDLELEHTTGVDALRLVRENAPAAGQALQAFEARWREDALVMDKWFVIQACVPGEATVERVRQLMAHPSFSLTNPNKVRSLLGAFSMMNPTGFHAASGAG